MLIGDPVLIGDGLPTAAWRLEVGISRVRAGGVASVLVGNGLQDCGTDLIVALDIVDVDVDVAMHSFSCGMDAEWSGPWCVSSLRVVADRVAASDRIHRSARPASCIKGTVEPLRMVTSDLVIPRRRTGP